MSTMTIPSVSLGLAMPTSAIIAWAMVPRTSRSALAAWALGVLASIVLVAIDHDAVRVEHSCSWNGPVSLIVAYAWLMLTLMLNSRHFSAKLYGHFHKPQLSFPNVPALNEHISMLNVEPIVDGGSFKFAAPIKHVVLLLDMIGFAFHRGLAVLLLYTGTGGAVGNAIALVGVLDAAIDIIETLVYQAWIANGKAFGVPVLFHVCRGMNSIKHICYWLSLTPVWLKAFSCIAVHLVDGWTYGARGLALASLPTMSKYAFLEVMIAALAYQVYLIAEELGSRGPCGACQGEDEEGAEMH